MKKTLIAMVLVVFLFAPLPSKAMTSEEVAQFQAIINVLIQQVIALQQQLLILLQKQNEIAAQQTQIVTTQTQIVENQTLGKVAEPVVITVNKELKVEPWGRLIYVGYLEDGRLLNGVEVNAQGQGTFSFAGNPDTSRVDATSVRTSKRAGKKNNPGASFYFNPTEGVSGPYTITISANGVSKTVEVE